MDAVRKQRHTATPSKRHVMFGMRPTIACRSEWHRVEALQRNTQFCADHAEARARLLNGEPPHFPRGTTWSSTSPIARAPASLRFRQA